VGRVKEVLGEIDDPGMEIEIAVRKYSVPYEVLGCLHGRRRGRCRTRCAQDKKHRVDLTDIPLVTIDGEDARDFDDAVYCEPARVGPRQRLAAAGGDCGRQPLRGDRQRHRCGCV
jgi:ribonuclease R